MKISNMKVFDKPENVDLIDSLGFRVSSPTHAIHTSTGKEFDFSATLMEPWAIIHQVISTSRNEGYDLGKSELQSEIKELLGVNGE